MKNALSFFFWPSSLRLWKRVKASTRLCSASSLMSFSSFSNMSSGVIFGFAVYRKDFGQEIAIPSQENGNVTLMTFSPFGTVIGMKWNVSLNRLTHSTQQ